MILSIDTIAPWAPYRVEAFPRSNGRVMLGEVLSTYTIMQYGIGPMQIAEAFGVPGDDRTRDMAAGAIRFIGGLLIGGRFATYARPLGGGEPVEMAPSMWELDDFTDRFATCALNLARPFDASARPTHRIFMGQGDLQVLMDACCEDVPSRVRRSSGRSVAKATSKPFDPVGTHQPDRLLRLPEVERLVGFKRSTIYARMAEGRFPELIKSGTISVWRESDIQVWLADPR